MEKTINSYQREKLLIDELTKSFFKVFTNSNNEIPDWNILFKICIPEVIIIKKEDLKQEVYNLEEFIKPRKVILEDGSLLDFEEYEIDNETKIIGNIAQRIVKYNKKGILNGKHFNQFGNKLFQFIKTNDGWKINSIVWEDD